MTMIAQLLSLTTGRVLNNASSLGSAVARECASAVDGALASMAARRAAIAVINASKRE